MKNELLTLQGLCKYYTSGQNVVVGLDKIDLSFSQGEFVAITGESGSGKSTLAHVLAGILPYEGGELLCAGRPTSHYGGADWEDYRRDRISFISQSYGILPGNTVLSNVVTALLLVGMDKATARQRAEDALRKVELWDLRRRRASKLSSGQKQRLAIARALARPAPILIADEPTGNLDAENSAKVISLLAEAAKDRLVILITHEFSECAHCATRHISLHDGRVTMDEALRPPCQPPERPTLPHTRPKKGLSLSVAGLQLRARPVWVCMMLALFTVTVFTVVALAGTFLSNLDDTSTHQYNNSAFRNGDSRRIAVVRTDGEDLTEEDYAALAGVKYVEAVERWGHITDINYAWRPDVDYKESGRLVNLGEGMLDQDFVLETTVSLIPSAMSFARTVPLMADDSGFLSDGRLPESIYEVVAPRGSAQIGDTIPIYFSSQKDWSEYVYFHVDVTVVGLTDYGSELYFHSDLGQVLTGDAVYSLNYHYLVYPGDTYTLTSTLEPPFINSSTYIPAEAQLTGRLPESIDEILMVGPSSLIGTVQHAEFEVSWHTTDADGVTQKHTALVERDLTVVGTATYPASASGSIRLYSQPEELWMSQRQLEEYRQFLESYDPLRDEYMDIILAHSQHLREDHTIYPEDSPTFLRWSEQNGGAGYSEYVAQAEQRLAQCEQSEAQYREYEEKLSALCAQYPMITLSDNPLSPYIITVPVEDYERFLAEYAQLEALKATDPETYQQQLADLRGACLTLHPMVPPDTLTARFPLLDDQVLYPPKTYESIVARNDSQGVFLAWTYEDEEGQPHDLICVGHTDSTHPNAQMYNFATFRKMGYFGGSDQASLTIEDYAYTDRVLEAVQELGYIAVSPYREGAGAQVPELAEQRMQTLRICIIALVVAIVLQVVVLRAMFSLENENYRLMSNIGLDRAAAKRSVFWQILVFAVIGQVLGLTIVLFCGAGGVESVARLLRYMDIPFRAALCAVHLCVCLLTSLWVMRALEKKVYPDPPSAPDLDWSGDGEEAEA